MKSSEEDTKNKTNSNSKISDLKRNLLNIYVITQFMKQFQKT